MQRRATASGGPQPFERAADGGWGGVGPLRHQGSDASQLSPAGSGEMQRGWSVDLSDPSDSASGAAASPTAGRGGGATANGGSSRSVFSGRAAARNNLQSLPEGIAELTLGSSDEGSGHRGLQGRHNSADVPTSSGSHSRLGPRLGSDGDPKVQVALDALAAGLVAGGEPSSNGTGSRRMNGARGSFGGVAVGKRETGGAGGSGTLGGLTRGSGSRPLGTVSSPQSSASAVRLTAGTRSPVSRGIVASPGSPGPSAATTTAKGADSPLQALAGLGAGVGNARGLLPRRQLKEEDFSGSGKREEWVVPGAAQPRRMTAVTPPRARDDTCTAREGLVKSHAALFEAADKK